MPARLGPELHLFRAGGLRLAFAPLTDSLFLLDEVGWDALELVSAGTPADRARALVSRRHGGAAADRCLAELDEAVAAHGLNEADPLAAGGDGREWLPSPAEAPALKALCLNVAHDCDLRCRYCFAGQGGFSGARGLMPAGVARAAVDFLLAHSGDSSSLEIDFFGGEPLLNLDVVRETVDYARRRGAEAGKRFGFTLTTNAARLGPDEASYLDAAMDNVVLSLDGRPEVHDRMRPFAGGRPSHAVILANVRRFVELRGAKDYWVRGTYTAFNLDFTADVAYLAGQGMRHVSLEPVVGGPVGAGRWGLGAGHLARVAAEYIRLADFLHSEAAAGRPVTFFHFIAEVDAGPCYAKRVRGCGAGREYMAVTPTGDLYPCHQFVGRAGHRLGDVLDGSFQPGEVGRLWLGAKPGCRSCWARYRCSGGCHANALTATGSLTKPDPTGCAVLKARLEASLYLEARLGLAGLARRAE